eukprot:m.95992 g.95992  ORF g.95992 m.95992 type:complete len:258 (+) comp26857_c0_seq3:168-941(+)
MSSKRSKKDGGSRSRNKTVTMAVDEYPEIKYVSKEDQGIFRNVEGGYDDILERNTVTKKPSAIVTKAAMADAMSKILGNSIADANPILAKAKPTESIKVKKLTKEQMIERKRKREALRADHVGIEHTPFELESKLRKIATRGVVLLFNAVRTKQKESEEAVAKKQDEPTLDKSKFLDMLKTTGSKSKTSAADVADKNDDDDDENEDEKEVKGGAKFLQEGYMTTGKHKDWESEEEDDDDDDDNENNNNAADAGSDSE